MQKRQLRSLFLYFCIKSPSSLSLSLPAFGMLPPWCMYIQYICCNTEEVTSSSSSTPVKNSGSFPYWATNLSSSYLPTYRIKNNVNHPLRPPAGRKRRKPLPEEKKKKSKERKKTSYSNSNSHSNSKIQKFKKKCKRAEGESRSVYNNNKK